MARSFKKLCRGNPSFLALAAFALCTLSFAACDSAEAASDAGPALDASFDAAQPDDAGTPDASPTDVPASDAAVDAPGPRPDDGFSPVPLVVETVPTGLVPVSVGLAHGRIVTSCDHMQSVALDDTFSPDADDHHEHSIKGAAFGNGVFVLATGHGAPGHVLRSTNGLDWTQLSEESFHYADGSTGLLSAGTAGVIFDGTTFVLLRGRAPRMFSTDGLQWTEAGEELDRRYFHHRGHHFFTSSGRLFIEGENVDKSERWLLMSEDSGVTFREIEYDELCRVPLVHEHNTLIAAGTMQVCTSFDEGETWTAQGTPEEFGSILATDDGFVALRGYRSFLHSFDAEMWTEETVDRSLRFAAAARSPWGWYWFASHQEPHFWLSDDTHTFRSVDAPSDGATIRRFVFGYAEPSERCPLLEEK